MIVTDSRLPDLLQEIQEWLRECSDWMIENDLDMRCPMTTDPACLADRIVELTRRHGDSHKVSA